MIHFHKLCVCVSLSIFLYDQHHPNSRCNFSLFSPCKRQIITTYIIKYLLLSLKDADICICCLTGKHCHLCHCLTREVEHNFPAHCDIKPNVFPVWSNPAWRQADFAYLVVCTEVLVLLHHLHLSAPPHQDRPHPSARQVGVQLGRKNMDSSRRESLVGRAARERHRGWEIERLRPKSNRAISASGTET